MMNDFTNNPKLVPSICTQCGGQNEVNPSQEKVVCNYCGTSFFVEKGIQTYNVHNAKVEHVYSVNIKGPIASVLTFVEKQQDKKQQKIDEEKRRIEEEKRKKEEQKKEIIEQIINIKYRKRNFVILGVIIFVVIFICSCLGILSSNGGTTKEPETIIKIKIPASASDLKGENYQDVVAKFENAGFTNVRTEVIDDLVLGLFTKDGEVEEVSVDGNTSFSASSSYPKDVPIVVTYHTFPAVEKTEVAESSTPESTVKAKPTESLTPESTVEATPTEKAQSTEVTQSSTEEEILTVDNNEEFAAVLNAKDPADQIIKDFAVKYAGRIIEFDGNIANMIYYGDATKKYDFLIYAWDYSETSVSGPSFQFRNCSFFDLNLIGDIDPDAVGMGDNLHFVAKIINFNETQDLFYLDPISTEAR